MDSKSYANCYHFNRSEIDEQASAILNLISDYIGPPSNTSILDIGSGPGRLSIPIGQQVQKMVCIESDLRAVTHLKKRAKENNIEIEVYPSKVEDLSSEKVGSFDLVMLSHIIHWFDASVLINLSQKFIKDNGYILLSYFDLDNLKNMLFYNVSGKEILKIQKSYTHPTPRIEHLLNLAGFKTIHRTNIPLNVDYGNGKLESIINNAGTLAWQTAKERLSEKDFSILKECALTRLNNAHQLNDIEYRTMILAQKYGMTK